MFGRWLTGVTKREFLDTHFDAAPFAQPAAAKAALPLATWETCGRLLAASPPPDVMVVENGKLLDEPAPTSRGELEALMKRGVSVVIRKVELHDEALAALAADFAETLAGESTVHLFATPGNSHTFGWHYDAEDVFLIQTAGRKEYYFRRNTVNPRPTLANMPKDMQFERETTPMGGCSLVAGDWLYLPSGWWHVAKCLEDALSISVGVLSPRAAGKG